jgi:hypothetical protein
MKNLLFALALFFLSNHAHAQKLPPKIDSGTVAVRINFLSLIDMFDESISLGGEYHINPHNSVGIDASYIFMSLYYSNITNGLTNGYIIKPFYRNYFDLNRKRIKLFLEPDLFLKHEVFSASEWVQRQNFQQQIDYKIRKNVWGANLKVGYQFRMMSHGKMYFEVYAGIGVRGSRTSLSDTNIHNFTIRGFDRGVNPQKLNTSYYTASVPLGVRFTYVFCKRKKK